VTASGFDATDAPPADVINTCVHCGFCLPTCPTFVLWREEMDSPRGRIYLMKAIAEGRLELSDTVVGHFDACLGCMACVTACPSGVQYGTLIEKTRAQIERRYARRWPDRLFREVLFRVLPRPGFLRLALAPLALAGRPIRALAASGAARALPALVRTLAALAPPVSLRGLTGNVPAHTLAAGEQRRRVSLLTGCVQRVAFRHVNDATIRVLAAEGCAVDAPRDQGCCGALALHAGRIDEARAAARRTIAALGGETAERVVANAAGCGSAMKEYGELLAGDPAWAARARAFSERVRDVSEVLAELGEPRAPRHPIAARVAYHDACHLAHAQGVRAEPRALLNGIPGLDVVTAAESEICCGSAGIYNLVQPEPAAALGARKAERLDAVRPDIVATANPGCTLQISAAGRAAGCAWRVVHPVELLDASISGRTRGFERSQGR
jgi:glycolate oxidase iron-sulfur subunit